MSDSVRPHGLQPTRLLHPWDSPGKNTGVGCHALLQRIFPTQESNPGLPHSRQILYHLSQCPTLWDPMDCSPPGSLVHGIFQAWILEWVAIPFSRGSSWPRDRTQVSCIVSRRFTVWATREVPSLVITAAAAKSLQSCPTLCDPIDGSPPGPAVAGILQARTLEWVAISSSNAWKWKVKVKSLSHY